jgi:UbiD family decarboxylase
MPYRDLREYIAALERRGLLQTIDARVCKDTELVPLLRLQFRGLPEAQRKAFWFRNVTDARGRSFEGSVVLGSLGSSRAVYGAALDVDPAEIPALWARAQAQPTAPVVVERSAAPVKEIVVRAPDLGEGVDAFPHLISTPGFDPSAFITGGCWITRDPETGANNLGIYRGMIKAVDRIGCYLRHLRDSCNIPSVTKVATHEMWMRTSTRIRWTPCCGHSPTACNRIAIPRLSAEKCRASTRRSHPRATSAS